MMVLWAKPVKRHAKEQMMKEEGGWDSKRRREEKEVVGGEKQVGEVRTSIMKRGRACALNT